MALLTDAGTPGISDPAFLLVRECIKVGVQVECLPGATAFVPALINSGLPTNHFVFEGFFLDCISSRFFFGIYFGASMFVFINKNQN